MTQFTLSEELNFSFVVNLALVMVFHKYPKNNLFEYIFCSENIYLVLTTDQWYFNSYSN